jgi:hypothetical protein
MFGSGSSGLGIVLQQVKSAITSVVTSKAAIRGHLKTGQWSVAGTSWFLRL